MAQQLWVKTDTGWYVSTSRVAKKKLSRDTLEHLIELMRGLMSKDPKGTEEALRANGALLFRANVGISFPFLTPTKLDPGRHGFRLLPKNFTDAWNDVSPSNRHRSGSRRSSKNQART